MRISIAVLLAVLAATVAGCGSSGSGSSGSGTQTVVGARQAESGLVLVDDSDHTLYTFSGSVCKGACADVWHPLMADGDVVAKKDSGVDEGLLGTKERTGGGSQVTYDGHPLYSYANEQSGEATGATMSFGGEWKVARAKNPFGRQTTTGVSCEPNCGY
jgi:predicted lipoprotein with Yx(FWY)xxD motif